MANLSNAGETKTLNFLLRTDPVYLALFLNSPTDAGTGTEVSGTNYVRKPIAFTAPVQIDGKGVIKNTVDIEFNQAGSNWGTVTHGAIFDSLTGGEMIVWAPLNNVKIIETSDILKINANEFVVTAE